MIYRWSKNRLFFCYLRCVMTASEELTMDIVKAATTKYRNGHPRLHSYNGGIHSPDIIDPSSFGGSPNGRNRVPGILDRSSHRSLGAPNWIMKNPMYFYVRVQHFDLVFLFSSLIYPTIFTKTETSRQHILNNAIINHRKATRYSSCWRKTSLLPRSQIRVEPSLSLKASIDAGKPPKSVYWWNIFSRIWDWPPWQWTFPIALPWSATSSINIWRASKTWMIGQSICSFRQIDGRLRPNWKRLWIMAQLSCAIAMLILESPFRRPSPAWQWN